MSIIIGIVVPAILFLITLPLQSFLFILRQSLKVKEIQLSKSGKGSLEEELGFKRKDDDTDVVGDKKLEKMSLRALQSLLSAVSGLIVFIRSIASSLIVTVLSALIMLITPTVALIVATSGIVMLVSSSEGSGLTFGDVMSNISVNESTNIVTSSEFNGEWLEAIEVMADWYIDNINTYCTREYPPNTSSGLIVDGRKSYPCDLFPDNKGVSDDCSSFAWACLAYYGAVDSPTGAPNSKGYKSEDIQSELSSGGFKYHLVDSSTVFKAGDILVKSGHIEVLVGDNGDRTYKTFGWGTVRDSYPSTKSISLDSLIKSYESYYRLGG